MEAAKVLPLATSAKLLAEVCAAVVIVEPSLAKVWEGALWE
jgi:hypothetical protein